MAGFLIKNKKPHRDMQLNITSLVDILTILLVYMLMQYSVEGEVISISPNLILPSASIDKKPTREFVVSVSQNELMAEQVAILPLTRLPTNSLSIPELKSELIANREKVEAIGKSNARVIFTGKVMLQADKGTPFRVIKQVMFTCGEAGYHDISLVLRKRE